MSTVHVGPGHGDYGAFQPGSAISMGCDDLKVIEIRNFVRSIADGAPHGVTLDDAVQSAVVLEAISRSARGAGWVTLP